MSQIEPVKITLRLPRDIAQDVIVRHALNAREWQQLPFDPSEPPVEIESLDESFTSSELSARMLPWLLDCILRMVGDQGWSVRYDRETAVSVAGAVSAYALESGLRLVPHIERRAARRFLPAPPSEIWLN